MEWGNLLEAAEYLQLDLDQIKVKRLRDIAENGQYYLTFWGHYSAGKSRLINNILGKSILPVQVRETTAVMTYIRYDASEYAVVYFDNGKESKVALDDIRKIYQNTDEVEFESVENIDHIEIFMNHELLRKGLVIVDTPGVNTIISKHQDLAVNAIELSRKIVYVLGGPLTKADEHFIRNIKESGIDMLFVRTKCDLFNSDEENPMESLEKEKSDLQGIYGNGAKIHFVSNLPEKVLWHDNIESLKDNLAEITENIEQEFQTSFEQQKKILSDKFHEILKSHLDDKEALYRGEEAMVEKKLQESRHRIESLEKIMRRQSEQFESNVSKLKLEVKSGLPIVIEQSTDSFKSKMESIPDSPDAIKLIERSFQDEFQKSIEKLQKFYHVNFDDFVKAEEKPLQELLESDFDNLPTTMSFRDMEQQNSMMLKQYTTRLEEVRESLIFLQREKEAHGNAIDGLSTDLERNDYSAELHEIEEMLKSIPREIAMVESENQPIQPSKVLRSVGQVIDIGLLLVPGTAIASGMKAAVNTTKVANVLSKSGKVGQVIKNIALSSEAIGKVDKVRDTAFTLKNIMSKTPKITKKDKAAADKIVNYAAEKAGSTYEKYKANHGVLDMLEVAFWTEKIGRAFDKPIKMEVDEEEERQKKEYRDELYQKKTAILEEYNKKRQALSLNLSKQDELEKREEDHKRILADVEKETEKRAQLLKLQAEKKVIEDYKKQYITYFENNIRILSEKMLENYFHALSENMVFHQAQLNKAAMEDLEQEKMRLEDLLINQSDKETLSKDIEYIKELIVKLA